MTARRFGTRWGRTGVLVGSGLAALTIAGSAMATNALATYTIINSQNSPASFTSSAIVGQNVAFGMAQSTLDNGTTSNVLRAGFATAALNGLCVTKTDTIAGIQYTFKLTAGDGNATTNEITANNALFDLTSIRGSGPGLVLQGLDQIGSASADLTTSSTGGVLDTNPLGAPGGAGAAYGAGWAGIQASSGQLNNVTGTLWNAEIQGSINLPNLSISVSLGSGTPCSGLPLPN